MGRPKGSKNGQHAHRHGSTYCYYRCKCRCDVCTEGHDKHVVEFREYQRGRNQHGLKPSERRRLKARGCWVCGSFFHLAIDHDHACCPGRFGCEKCVRGVLCSPCNRILGYAKDDPKILRRLAEYLTDTNLITQIERAAPGELIDIWRVS